MTRLPFIKMQGVGNDFVVVDRREWPEGDWRARAVTLCDRRFGVGSDGLIVLDESEVADVRMRFFNPDGTEDMCGNGLRCLIRYAAVRGRFGDAGSVETLAGVRQGRIEPDGAITADMGVPAFRPTELPVNPALLPAAEMPRVLGVAAPLAEGGCATVSVVSTGTTHSILWREALPEDPEFFDISPRLERSPLFPERTSVMWTVVEAPDRLRLRIWERGVGETLGCGTGACAAAVLGRVEGKTDSDTVVVSSKGGDLRIAWSGDEEDTIRMTGPAQVVFEGAWPSDD